MARPITPLRKYCHNCDFWKWEPTIYLLDGSSAYPGHCGLESCTCINAVADGQKPVHFRPVTGAVVEEDIPSVKLEPATNS